MVPGTGFQLQFTDTIPATVPTYFRMVPLPGLRCFCLVPFIFSKGVSFWVGSHCVLALTYMSIEPYLFFFKEDNTLVQKPIYLVARCGCLTDRPPCPGKRVEVAKRKSQQGSAWAGRQTTFLPKCPEKVYGFSASFALIHCPGRERKCFAKTAHVRLWCTCAIFIYWWVKVRTRFPSETG